MIGDVEEGVYVRPGIEEFLRDRALPAADIATPNQFELERLTGLACATLAGQGARRALDRLHAAGPRMRAADQPADRSNAGRSI